jgi:hypothetical protein
MSACRQQVMIDAPIERIWELVGDPNRHPEWWPRIVEADCEDLTQGCTYRQVTRSPTGKIETDISLERLEDCHEVLMRCLDTGTYTRWLLTEARGGTFLDVEFGSDPQSPGARIFDRLVGKRFFRQWLKQSVDALERASRSAREAA